MISCTENTAFTAFPNSTPVFFNSILLAHILTGKKKKLTSTEHDRIAQVQFQIGLIVQNYFSENTLITHVKKFLLLLSLSPSPRNHQSHGEEGFKLAELQVWPLLHCKKSS